MQERNWSENQGSEPGNRLVKEPATTASSMGYKQHRVDLKQMTGRFMGGLRWMSDITREKSNLLVQSGVAASCCPRIFL